MEDLIKRSDATEMVYKALRTPPLKGALTDTMSLAVALVQDIPSADRPQGEWIETSEGTICGNCGASPYDDGEYRIANWHSNYCPHCGVPMKGADDE